MRAEPVFVKLGGSVITDKARAETPRPAVIARLAAEVAAARAAGPERHLLLGHGSGSFGHVAARRYGTRQGVGDAAGWAGFARVAAAAARLNRLVVDALLAAGVPAWSLQPSASARCRGGEIEWLETEPAETALAHGLVPLVYGDVALDSAQGATIISTEQIFHYLARRLHPARLILVGRVHGIFEADPLGNPAARPVPRVSAGNWDEVRALLGGSHATDVTGGMLAKVEEMVALARELPGLTVHLISGEQPGALQAALGDAPDQVGGTLIRWP
ncbi:MAG: isopentenyl phosphate kinase [Anaerolineae bacterium]